MSCTFSSQVIHIYPTFDISNVLCPVLLYMMPRVLWCFFNSDRSRPFMTMLIMLQTLRPFRWRIKGFVWVQRLSQLQGSSGQDKWLSGYWEPWYPRQLVEGWSKAHCGCWSSDEHQRGCLWNCPHQFGGPCLWQGRLEEREEKVSGRWGGVRLAGEGVSKRSWCWGRLEPCLFDMCTYTHTCTHKHKYTHTWTLQSTFKKPVECLRIYWTTK